MAAVLAHGTTVIDNAAREPEIVDLCQMLVGDGRADRRDRHVDAGDRGRRPAAARSTHTTVPDRIVAGTWAFGAVMTRGDVTVRDARAEHLEIAARQARRSAGATSSALDDGFRVSMDGRPRGGRRGDAAVSRLPDRPAADGAGPQRGGRGRGDGHREPLRGPVHVRRRARPARRRRPDRRPPRGRPRSRAAVGGTGAGHRHPGRRGSGHGRAVRRRASHGREGSTSTAATRASSRPCASSAPT